MKTPSALALATLLLAGCAPAIEQARPRITDLAPAWSQSDAVPGTVDQGWWQALGDPVLSGLLAQADAAAPDLREAAARLAEARANRDAVSGGGDPQLAARGSVTENRLSENGTIPIGRIPGVSRDVSQFDIGFDASWELDLWGRRTAQSRSATARSEAAAEAVNEVRLALRAEIARNYVDLRLAQAAEAHAHAGREAWRVLADLTTLRLRAGEATRQEAERAMAEADNADTSVANAQARTTAAALRIAALVGATPDAVLPRLAASAPIPVAPARIAAGLPSELLTRRPDIRRAARELAASGADIAVARADFFPRLTLLGGIGQQARNAGDLADGASTRFSLGPSFSWPILNGGALRAQLRAAGARSEASAARYDRAVLGALTDSETAINRLARAREAAQAGRDALAREESAFALVEQRVRAGEDDRLTLARARLALVAAQQRHDEARAAETQAAIALAKALGGGWSDEPAALNR